MQFEINKPIISFKPSVILIHRNLHFLNGSEKKYHITSRFPINSAYT